MEDTVTSEEKDVDSQDFNIPTVVVVIGFYDAL